MLAGHISCAFIDNASGLALLRDGQLRGLAVSGRRRLGVLPDIPSFGELGFPHFEPAIWQAVFLPLGTPAPIAASITAAVRAAIGSEEVSERLRGIGFEPVGGSAEALSSMIAAERETWSAVIAETGIRAAQ
jgi:tripartite-type tricarboxylate transporter receptor subunit TctC